MSEFSDSPPIAIRRQGRPCLLVVDSAVNSVAVLLMTLVCGPEQTWGRSNTVLVPERLVSREVNPRSLLIMFRHLYGTAESLHSPCEGSQWL